ncbi:hypothetical protein [Streptomyces sp. 8L]|uniref:hypothetical protein n=1 Tax=Streptomyces sp. 8L TaxID=2877242 RepID=UPI001CD5F9F3|nr:hypothetical protein [Streptomyces sp. 8L]MCA1223601.1 hypothetical protein [Streptomyces sp. 8L]
MITNTSGFTSTGKLAGHAFACAPSLGSSSLILNGTGMPGVFEMRPFSSLPGLDLSSLPVREHVGDERPTKALVAAGVAEQAKAYAFAAASAGAQTNQQTTHENEMWAFRGPEPWSPPA